VWQNAIALLAAGDFCVAQFVGTGILRALRVRRVIAAAVIQAVVVTHRRLYVKPLTLPAKFGKIICN
jgi:hypothetical protein